MSGIPLDVQAETARQDQLARDRINAKFIAERGRDAFDVQVQLGRINSRRFTLARATGKARENLLAANARNLAEAKRIFRKGNVDFRQLQSPNKNLLKTSDPVIQQVTTTPPADEPQFLHAPSDTFDIIGIQADPVFSPLIEPTGALFLKMNQTDFPTPTADFTAVTGRSRFDLVVDPRVLGTSKKFVFRILVHDLTGTTRTEKRIDFVFSPQRQQIDLGYIGLIPRGSERIRVELQAFTDNGKPASNVFNETHIKKGVTPPPPPPTKTCQCIDPVTGVITVTSGHAIDEVCPVCKLPPPPPPPIGGGVIEKIVMGALILGAVLPLGAKKK